MTPRRGLASVAAPGRLRSTWRKVSVVAGRGVIDDPHYTTPLYRKAEAARIIAVPAQTFRDWAVGYARKRLDGSQVVSAPIVTTLEPARPRGVSVPFVGLAEAYVVAAFTKAGLPMRRIRPTGLRCCGISAGSPVTRRTRTWWRAWWWSAAASRFSGRSSAAI